MNVYDHDEGGQILDAEKAGVLICTTTVTGAIFNLLLETTTSLVTSSGDHFSGIVSGRSIRLYGYGEGRYFNYTV